MKFPVSNFIWLGYASSMVYAGVTIIQYWIRYPDTSQFILNMVLAFLIFGLSWIYDKQKRLGLKLEAVEDNLQERLK